MSAETFRATAAVRSDPGVVWVPPRSGRFIEVELQFCGIVDLSLDRHPEQALRAVVIFVALAQLLRTASRPKIHHACVVDGKKAHRSTVLGRHVRNGSPIHHRQRGGARSEKLDELAHHPGLPQALGDRKRQIRRRDALRIVPTMCTPTTSGMSGNRPVARACRPPPQSRPPPTRQCPAR
jgi:hypothetical protein